MGFKKLIKKAAPLALGAAAGYFGSNLLGGVLGGGTPTSDPKNTVEVTGSTGNWSPWVTGGASMLGGLMTNQSNAKQASQQMDFQASQTGSAHQREVADLAAAGLNPILSGTGGMGSASASGAQATMGNPVASGVNSAMETRMNNEQIQNIRQDTVTKQAAADASTAQAAQAFASADNMNAETEATRGYRAIEAASRTKGNTAKAILDELDRQQHSSWSDFYASKFGKMWPYAEKGLQAGEMGSSALANLRNAINPFNFGGKSNDVSKLPSLIGKGGPQW
ncbi:MAG: DNA pilot protein [Microviridae sp.]|nr:MAG: DNA pilot protein [Microviridae sp.]